MRFQRYAMSALMPPVGACRFGCGTNCAAPVTVFWLFGVVSVVYGFLGGPMGEPGISWYTVGAGPGDVGDRCGMDDADHPGGRN